MTVRVVIVTRLPEEGERLRECTESDPGVQVLAVIANARSAMTVASRLRPDLLLLDMNYPVVPVDELVRHVMADTPTPILLLLSSASDKDAHAASCALEAGALAVAERPDSRSAKEGCTSRMASMVKTLAAVKVVRRRMSPRRVPAVSAVARNATHVRRVRLVVIAASTGGPGALRAVLSTLPRSFPAPVLVVQHFAQDFIGTLAEWISQFVELDVRVAGQGNQLLPGCVYLAPDHAHLGVRTNGTVQLSVGEHVGGFRPSATHLFESAAQEFGPSVLAVMLTGMGSDGVTGLEAIRTAGGYVLAQDEASSVVFGMPGEATRAGLVHEVLALELLGPRINHLVCGENDAE